MTHEAASQPRTPPTSPATPEKRALLEAFDTVLKSQVDDAERSAAERAKRARGAARALLLSCAMAMVLVGTYLWVERPEWVFPPIPAAESFAVKDASLRIAMANAAQHIERYRQRGGRLPVTLASAGVYSQGIEYRLTDREHYQLTGENGDVRLALRSDESVPEFLKSSFQILARRTR